MKRGGYDSYRSEEAIRQAEARGENVGWDRAFGVAGSLAESLWLAALAAVVCYFAGQALFTMGVLLPAMIVVVTAAFAAPRSAGWLVRPFGDSSLRRLLWGLSAAATLLLIVRMALAAVLVVHMRLQGVGEKAAGIAAFEGAAIHADDRHASLVSLCALGLAATAFAAARSRPALLAPRRADPVRHRDDGLPGSRGRVLR